MVHLLSIQYVDIVVMNVVVHYINFFFFNMFMETPNQARLKRQKNQPSTKGEVIVLDETVRQAGRV